MDLRVIENISFWWSTGYSWFWMDKINKLRAEIYQTSLGISIYIYLFSSLSDTIFNKFSSADRVGYDIMLHKVHEKCTSVCMKYSYINKWNMYTSK